MIAKATVDEAYARLRMGTAADMDALHAQAQAGVIA